MADEKHDAQEVKEILGVVSTEIPKLIESISSVMYKTENAENLAKAVSSFYKQMKAAGMDDKQAFELTQKFMSNFSLGGMISQAIGAHSGHEDNDIGKAVKEQIKKKIEESGKDE